MEILMTVLFWLLTVILLLVFLVSLFNSTNGLRKEQRYIDLLVAVVSFMMIMLLKMRW